MADDPHERELERQIEEVRQKFKEANAGPLAPGVTREELLRHRENLYQARQWLYQYRRLKRASEPPPRRPQTHHTRGRRFRPVR